MFKSIVVGLMLAFFCSNQVQAAVWQDITQGEYQYTALKNKITSSGPTLVFSDSPEYVRDYGVLYEDKLQGDIRIFYYHVNDQWPESRIAVVVVNEQLRPVAIKVAKRAMPKPSYHWQRDGQLAQQLYFGSHQPYETKLGMYESLELLNGHNGLLYKKDELAQGIIELHTDAPVTIKIVSLPPTAKVNEYLDIAQPIAADDVRTVPLRGTFVQANRTMVLEPLRFKNAVEGVVIADGVSDKFAVGKDAVTGKIAENYGNYGVFYEVLFENKSDDKFAVRLNGTGGLIAGQILVGSQKTKNLRKVDFPSKGTQLFSESGQETVLLGEFPAGFKGRVLFSPPGTGNLPVTLLFYKIVK